MRSLIDPHAEERCVRVPDMRNLPETPAAEQAWGPGDAVPYRSLSIRRLLQLHSALWFQHVSTEVSSVQYGVLYFLNRHGELGQRELMDLAQLDKSSLAELLSRMEANGTIATARDPRDRRRKVVTLTPAGHTLFTSLSSAAVRVNDMLTAGLTATETSTLDRLLEKAFLTADLGNA